MGINYTKTVWVNDQTPLNADNLNKIEDIIEGLCAYASNLSTSFGELSAAVTAVIEEFQGDWEQDDPEHPGYIYNKPTIPSTPEEVGAEPVIETKGTAFNKNFAGTGEATDVARSDHGHDDVYSLLGHDHDEAYAALGHGHDNAVPTGEDEKDGFMSHADKKKLDDIATAAQVNVIEEVTVDGTPLVPTNKSVAVDLSGKVDKVEGKDLSTNDYDNIAAGKVDLITITHALNLDTVADLLSKVAKAKTLVAMAEEAPVSASDGDIYYNTSTKKLWTWDDNAWIDERDPSSGTLYGYTTGIYIWTSVDLADITQVDLSNYIQTVNGESPNEHGAVTVPTAIAKDSPNERDGTITKENQKKLDGIEAGAVAAGAAGDAHAVTAHAPSDAQKNVNPDWNATEGDAQILNKPAIPENTDTQADWNEANTESPAFVQNKPTIPTVPTISTNIETDRSDDTKTASPKAVGDYVDALEISIINGVNEFIGGE